MLKTIIFIKIFFMRSFLSKWLMPICTIILFVTVLTSCSKGGGDNTTPPVVVNEADLIVTTTPTINSILTPAALGSGLPVTVNISSVMPSGGVKIDVTARLETASNNFFTTSVAKSTTAANSFTVTSIPTGGQACVCTVAITSLSKATNTWSGTFKFANK